MFWKKKTAFQIIVRRWDAIIPMEIAEDASSYMELLGNAFSMFSDVAAMRDSNKALRLTKEGSVRFRNLLRGSYLIGFDYGMNHHTENLSISQMEDLPPEVDESITEVCQPLAYIGMALIDLGHNPNVSVEHDRRKEIEEKTLGNRVYDLSAKYFFQGVIFARKYKMQNR